jgi:hypothetical protein
MKTYSTHTSNIQYTRNNMEHFFKEYQGACIDYNTYYNETQKLTSIDNLSTEEPFNDIKDNIVLWLADMAKAGLIDKKDSVTVDNLLNNAYGKLNSTAIEKKLEELNQISTQKLNSIQRSFDEAEENKGYLIRVLDIQIKGLTLDKVEVINKILEKEGVHVSSTYYDNGSKDRGNFDTKIYADNSEVLSDVQSEINMAALKYNFKGNVKRSEILDSNEAFRLMTRMNNDVMIGSHIDKIIKPIHMQYHKPKEVGKPKFGH